MLDLLPHRAADGVLERRRSVERGGDDGEKRDGGQCHEIQEIDLPKLGADPNKLVLMII